MYSIPREKYKLYTVHLHYPRGFAPPYRVQSIPPKVNCFVGFWRVKWVGARYADFGGGRFIRTGRTDPFGLNPLPQIRCSWQLVFNLAKG